VGLVWRLPGARKLGVKSMVQQGRWKQGLQHQTRKKRNLWGEKGKKRAYNWSIQHVNIELWGKKKDPEKKMGGHKTA